MARSSALVGLDVARLDAGRAQSPRVDSCGPAAGRTRTHPARVAELGKERAAATERIPGRRVARSPARAPTGSRRHAATPRRAEAEDPLEWLRPGLRPSAFISDSSGKLFTSYYAGSAGSTWQGSTVGRGGGGLRERRVRGRALGDDVHGGACSRPDTCPGTEKKREKKERHCQAGVRAGAAGARGGSRGARPRVGSSGLAGRSAWPCIKHQDHPAAAARRRRPAARGGGPGPAPRPDSPGVCPLTWARVVRRRASGVVDGVQAVGEEA